jgi:hypothetical protein
MGGLSGAPLAVYVKAWTAQHVSCPLWHCQVVLRPTTILPDVSTASCGSGYVTAVVPDASGRAFAQRTEPSGLSRVTVGRMVPSPP